VVKDLGEHGERVKEEEYVGTYGISAHMMTSLTNSENSSPVVPCFIGTSGPSVEITKLF